MTDVTKDLLEALKAAQAYVCGPTAWTQEQEDTLVEAMSKAIAAAEAPQAEPVDERVIDRTWARFCGAFGDGPDAPYPGMIAAFETHYGQSFRDKAWRTEAACWAAAWSKATARAEAALAEPDADGWIPWAGGKCPVPPDTLVDVKVKPRHEVMYRRFARNLEWSHDDPWCNHIDFYRIAGEEK